jgi:prepilin-type processing-associated H-X9-DG protein
VALILGCVTFLLPVLAAIPAIVLALLALKDIGAGQGRLTGKGLAIAGLILGVAGNISLLPIILVYQNISEARDREQSLSNLKQIGFALHNYHDAYKRFPANAIYSKDGKALLSWRVAILPFIEQGPLVNQFKMDEPWDGPNNIRLLKEMPAIYAPVRGSTPQPHCTYYQVFTGPNTLFPGPGQFQGDFARLRGPRLMEIVDGTSNTFLVAEAAEAVPWTKPADVEISPARPLPRLGGMWRDGFNVLMADGSVRRVSSRVREATLRLLIDPRDGMPLPDNWDN